MSEFDVESRPVQPPRRRGSAVAVSVVIAVTIVALACIAATTVILYVFFQNPPW
jgi:hypothetical protein